MHGALDVRKELSQHMFGTGMTNFVQVHKFLHESVDGTGEEGPGDSDAEGPETPTPSAS